MNEDQIALAIITLLGGLAIFGLFMCVSYTNGSMNGAAEERRKIREAARRKASENTTGPGSWLKPPGESIVQSLSDGRIEIVHHPMPWRLEIASRAMQGMHANSELWRSSDDGWENQYAKDSLRSADALLKAFNESEQKSLKDSTPSFGVKNLGEL